MRNKIIILVVLFLTACSGATTLQQKYFVLKQNYLQLLNLEVQYKKNCDTKPADHYCYDVVNEIRNADDKVFMAFERADATMLDEDITNVEAAIAAAEIALQGLSQLVKEKINDTPNT